MRMTLLLLILLPFYLWAQNTHVEVQVPMDTSGSITEITPELRNKTGLFPEVTTFIAAKLFHSDDSTFILEIAFRQNSLIARKRTILDNR